MPVLRIIINQYFNRHYIRSYSQYGEDLIIYDFFKRYFDIKGNYLDIGAFHPKMISNTHILHTLGWRGTVIDLDDFKIKLFERNLYKQVPVKPEAKVLDFPSGGVHKIPVDKQFTKGKPVSFTKDNISFSDQFI